MQRKADKVLLAQTTRCQNEPYFDEKGEMSFIKFPLLLENQEEKQKLYKPRKCYVCKEHFFEVHHFYHQLCSCCADFNYENRAKSTDLSGYVALVTGGRIKIGFETALKLLRAGAKVHVTSRFKQDTIRRYAKENDFESWRERLVIHAIDFKNLLSVELFIAYFLEKEERLDILINNACQTIRKPDEYYQQLAQREQKLLSNSHESYLLGFNDTLIEHKKYLPIVRDVDLAPLDEFDEPVDMQSKNSWLTTLDSVDTLELVEVHLVNAIVPFMLNSKLKPLMLNSKFNERFIVNVSSMEGQFNRENKTDKHPHTNMAKASLNMMTRTSAKSYAKEGIYMNSVDTGWVTQEHAFEIKNKNRLQGMVPPLDVIDGASRVLAPIFDAVAGEEAIYGKFLKDYGEVEW